MPPAGHLVRAGVAQADRLRRSRETARRLWRAAPIAAALSVAVAGVSRWAGWPVFVPLGAVALAAASLAGLRLFRRGAITPFPTSRPPRSTRMPDSAANCAARTGSRSAKARIRGSICTSDGPPSGYSESTGHCSTPPSARTAPRRRARLMAIGALALALWVPGRLGIQARTPATGSTARTQKPSSSSPHCRRISRESSRSCSSWRKAAAPPAAARRSRQPSCATCSRASKSSEGCKR